MITEICEQQIKVLQNMILRNTTILQEYLSILKSLNDLVIIIAVKDTPGFQISDKIDAQLRDLGLNCSLKNKHWCGYIAVIDSRVNVFETIGKVDEKVTGSLLIDSKYKLRLVSAPLNAGDAVEINIDGIDYAQKKRGLNIVVYDKKMNYIVDSVCFDTHRKSLDCIRGILINQRTDQIKKSGIEAKISDIGGVRNRLKIESILSQKELEKLNGIEIIKSNKIGEKFSPPKIEVRIFFFGAAILWNSLRTIALEFQNDPNYHLLVILEYNGGKLFGKEDIVKSDGLEYINDHEYNIAEDKPDIFISNAAGYLSRYIEYTRFSVLVPCTLIDGSISSSKGTTDSFLEKSKRADCIFLERLTYNKVRDENMLQDNILEIGNPKFDCIYEKLHRKSELSGTWNKVNGKSVILWTTDHHWDTNNITFDLYVKDVLKYFNQREDIALIIRPHYSYIQELITVGIWTEDSYNMLKEYCNRTKNIIWDDTNDYSLAYSLADGVLADTNCGITVSAMVLDKPLGVMQRFDNNVCMPHYSELVENLYRIDSIEKCIQFFEMVYRGEDPMKDQRHSMFDKYICNFDGKNGLRIKEIIEQKYNEKLC